MTEELSDEQLEEDVSRVSAVPPVVVPRWIQAVVLPLGLLLLWAVARAARPVPLLLVAAGTIALILNPLVKKMERSHVPRGLAILFSYLAMLVLVAAVLALLTGSISSQISRLEKDVPRLIHQANHELSSVQSWLDRQGIKVQIQKQGQTALQTLEKNVLKSSGSILSFSRDILSQAVTTFFYLILVLVLSIYMLVYAREIGELVRRVMPDGDGTPADDYPRLVQRAVFGYVRGQLLFSFIMGASAALCLWIFGLIGIFPAGEQYAVFFGAFYGLAELIPYIGPIIGPIPAILVALFNHPISALWVLLLFVSLQQLEGHVVAPQVFRISLRINPILIILALLIGYETFSVPGALVALPLATVIRQTVLYLRRHLVLEPWARTAVEGPGPPRTAARCPDCGAAVDADDAHCRHCGAALTPPVQTRS
jgi:predicted PurR-regulated permease PerM